MKVLHVADLHVGKRVSGFSLLEDQRHILGQVLDIAKEHQVDALLIAGDIYDKAAPSAEAVALFDEFLTRAVAAGLRVLAVPGNHDSSERIAYAQKLLSHQGVSFPPVYAGQVERVVLQDEFGDVAFWLLPFLKPGDVRRFFPDAEIGDSYGAALEAALSACDIDTAQRNVVLSHQLVTAFGTSPERADDEIKLGGLDNVDFGVYDQFDYVALGHVHRPQRVGRDTVRYAGSPLKYSFSEARYGKSAVLVEIGVKPDGAEIGECARVQLVPLTPLHDLREVRCSLAEIVACTGASPKAAGPLGGGAADEADNVDTASGASASAPSLDYVHITLTDEKPQLDAMARVRDAFPNVMALDYEFATALLPRTETRAALDPDETDIVALFKSFYEEQTGGDLNDEQERLLQEFAYGHTGAATAEGGPSDASANEDGSSAGQRSKPAGRGSTLPTSSESHQQEGGDAR